MCRLKKAREWTHKDVAAKYCMPMNTYLVNKDKDKLFAALKKGNNLKWQKLRKEDLYSVDQAEVKWFLIVQSQNVPMSGAFIQEKALHLQYGIIHLLRSQNFPKN